MQSQSQPEQPELLKPQEAARLLAVSLTTFDRIVNRGEIPYYTLGKRRKYKRNEVLAYLDAHPEAIVVAPECNHEGNKRLEEYCPYESGWFGGIHGTGRAYLNWLTGEFKPYIDAHYPTDTVGGFCFG